MKCFGCRKPSGKFLYCKACEADRTTFKAPTVIYKGEGFTKKTRRTPKKID